jgi:hypothetical protein
MTTPPTTLHERIQAELDRRTAVANAATPGPWTVRGIGDFGWAVHFEGGMPRGIETEDNKQGRDDADFIALHDPADALRRYAGELEVLERHALWSTDLQRGCDYCRFDQYPEWPCPEIRSLASRLGVSVDG